MGMEIHVAVTC